MAQRSQLDQLRRERARLVRTWSVTALRERMLAAGVRRAFVLYENGEFCLSHPDVLAPLQAFFELSSAFADHEAVFIGLEEDVPTLFFAFVHDTRRGLAQGGLRFDAYPDVGKVLEDGLRLAQGMTRKNALAGLWWGGGKGVMPLPPGYGHPKELGPGPERRRCFEAYGRFVASLGGVYYTAEDVGTNTADMDAILSQNRFTTCISARLGGSGNPSAFTARGVLRAMQAAWSFLHGDDTLKGVHVAVQGAGNVGRALIEALDDAGATVTLCDVNEAAVEALCAARPRLRRVAPEGIYDVDAQVFAPCARGGCVNAETIPRLRVELVCGAANNILGEPLPDGRRLRERGITFVPDYLCNRMGIVNCADEWRGYLREDIRSAAEKVFPDTQRVLRHAQSLQLTTSEAADQLADLAASELHPLLGHRGRRIVDHLQASGWHRAPAEERRAGTEPAFLPALHEPGARAAWQRSGLFRGHGPALCAAPIGTARRPDVAGFLSALLLDVRARALSSPPRRVLGSEHGGLGLELAVERSLPCAREDIGKPAFVGLCRDLHQTHDSAVRQQLERFGVGFDPEAWLNPVSRSFGRHVQRLFHCLQDAGALRREQRLVYWNPEARTVLVSADIERSLQATDKAYALRFATPSGQPVLAQTFAPEWVLGAVGLAVASDGPYAELAGQSARDPLRGIALPIVAVEDLPASCILLVPAHNRRDNAICVRFGLSARPEVFNERGEVRLPEGATLPLAEARTLVIERLGGAVEVLHGEYTVEQFRCRRRGSLVIPGTSEQYFLHLGRAVPILEQMLKNGAVRFSHPRWAARVRAELEALEPICISRQHWWGQPLPEAPGHVFSTWFSLIAWGLVGAGWPEQPFPTPLDEVYADPLFLERWVVPSLLVAGLLFGRPLFRQVQVHGALRRVERHRIEDPEAGAEAPDEERWLLRPRRRMMRHSPGHGIEPITLIERFGADALRLGCLLGLRNGYQETTTFSASHLVRAKRVIGRLVGKITGLAKLGRDAHGPARLAEAWLLAALERSALRAAEESAVGRLASLPPLFCEAVDALARYARVVSARSGERGPLRRVLRRWIVSAQPAFGPVCPFVFATLDGVTRELCAGDAPLRLDEPRRAQAQALLEGRALGKDWAEEERAELLRVIGTRRTVRKASKGEAAADA